jgi:hypothetical protein
VTREVEHYDLDMILALGFRVRSPVAVRFRQWTNDYTGSDCLNTVLQLRPPIACQDAMNIV